MRSRHGILVGFVGCFAEYSGDQACLVQVNKLLGSYVRCEKFTLISFFLRNFKYHGYK